MMMMMRMMMYTDCESNGPLGLITSRVEDWQITASSTYPSNWDAGCHQRYARVYQPNGVAWCAKHKSSSEWLQVDLGVPAKVRLLIAIVGFRRFLAELVTASQMS